MGDWKWLTNGGSGIVYYVQGSNVKSQCWVGVSVGPSQADVNCWFRSRVTEGRGEII